MTSVTKCRNEAGVGALPVAYLTLPQVDEEHDNLYGGDSPSFVEDRYNVKGTERGNCDLDNRHRIAAGYVYQIPLIPSLAGGSTGGAARALSQFVRDWRIGGMTTYRTGGPFTILADQIDPLVEGPYSGFSEPLTVASRLCNISPLPS